MQGGSDVVGVLQVASELPTKMHYLTGEDLAAAAHRSISLKCLEEGPLPEIFADFCG